MRKTSVAAVLPLLLALTAYQAIPSARADDPPVNVGTFGQEVSTQYAAADGLPGNNVVQVLIAPDGAVIAETTGGWARNESGTWTAFEPSSAGYLSRAELRSRAETALARYLADHSIPREAELIIHDAGYWRPDRLWIASNYGAFAQRPGGELMPVQRKDGAGRTWATNAVRTLVMDNDTVWIGMPAGVLHKQGDEFRFYTGDDGLPFSDFTCAAAGPDGAVWFGTTKGVVRFQNGEWSYRQGRRWIPGDRVTDIALAEDGSAWIGTDAGIAHIHLDPMTLADKAAYYEKEMALIKRTPYGYTSEVRLKNPGDKSGIIHTDSDNDGLWTAMYGAGECFAYAATGDPAAKERARQAFEALRFLQKVTQGGEHSPPKGFVARTILPAGGRDPNIGRLESDQRSHDEYDAFWKVYEPRWPKSADGKWYWKSDTSSDELDGHYFFYPAYYDLVADTDTEKERVREVVRDLTDHLIEHDFQLIDHDGRPTRWAVFNPDKLNDDRRWYVERGLNSLSMLSYLAVAEHVTGDAKYAEASRYLIDECHYAQNAMVPKIQFGIGSGNQSDDEMAFMSFYNLIKYTKNDELRDQIRYSFYQYWKLEYPEMNPFFNFAFAASCRGATYTSQWGTMHLDPWDGWLDDALRTLKGFPLDRINWAQQNSHRLDIVALPRQNTVDPDATHPPRRGYRVNGKVLPVEERHFNHWNTDPWDLDYGGDGRTLASGTVYLLPYYMGLYHGFIE